MMHTVILKDEVIEFLDTQTKYIYPDNGHAYLVNNMMYYSTEEKNMYIAQYLKQEEEYYDEY